jgi:protein gp37
MKETDIFKIEAVNQKQKKSVFNRTNDNIEWAKWTWNPVTGCEHGCPYCYARHIAIRFNGGFRPTFHQNRLDAPLNTANKSDNRNVFVCSMADLFGDWVPQEWIDKVFGVVRKTPRWNYLFLTKNPKRYLDIQWPVNAWAGATADTQKRADDALGVFRDLEYSGTKPVITFLSCEPLSGYIRLKNVPIDWLIIGGRSKTSKMPEAQPEWEWVEGLLVQARERGIRIYFKPNLTIRPKEYPEGLIGS